jgi:hypothetical protein
MVTDLISMQEIIQLHGALLDMPFQVIWNCLLCSKARTPYSALDGSNGIRYPLKVGPKLPIVAIYILTTFCFF